MGTYAKVDAELFHIHFPGRGNHFSKGDRSKNAKGPKVHYYFSTTASGVSLHHGPPLFPGSLDVSKVI